MKYAWISLIAGVSLVAVASIRMMDIFVLQGGIIAAASGLTALFLNAKRMEALAGDTDSPDDEGSMEGRAA